jgi:hypothetical protein
MRRQSLPRRVRFGRFAGAPLCDLPASDLSELWAFLQHGPLRLAVLAELQLRAGSSQDPEGRLYDALEACNA